MDIYFSWPTLFFIEAIYRYTSVTKWTGKPPRQLQANCFWPGEGVYILTSREVSRNNRSASTARQYLRSTNRFRLAIQKLNSWSFVANRRNLSWNDHSSYKIRHWRTVFDPLNKNKTRTYVSGNKELICLSLIDQFLVYGLRNCLPEWPLLNLLRGICSVHSVFVCVKTASWKATMSHTRYTAQALPRNLYAKRWHTKTLAKRVLCAVSNEKSHCFILVL